MNISFDNISIHNFKSLGEAEVRLDGRGIVMVKGVNTYESTAASNGSGKTSIFSALFWALYGKTPEGISNPSNRYTKGSCQVNLTFSVDSNQYEVKRYMKGATQHVELYVNSNNQSGRNRTDTDKLIKEDILRMSPDIFLSLVYLSQGFGSRLSLLTPTLRKDRLEQLTDTAKRIAEFSDSMSQLESNTASQINVLSGNYSRLSGSKDTYNRIISEINDKIDRLSKQRTSVIIDDIEYTSSSIPLLTSEANAYSEQQSNVAKQMQPIQHELSTHCAELRQFNSMISNHKSKITTLDSNLASLNSSQCPTCHQSIDTDLKLSLSSQYLKEKSELEKAVSELGNSVESHTAVINDLEKQLAALQADIANLESKRSHISYIMSQIPKSESISISDLQQEKITHEATIEQLSEELSQLDSELVVLNSKKCVMSHCRQLITKQFRAYLLSSAIVYLNSRLKIYSEYLFSNNSDCVSLSGDSQKLDITLGDADYETLSGGEQRRVDLIMMLAQRDLALEVAGMSCNILIMDEIMESMDETATQSALSLLESQSHSVDSMFIISHNDYSLPIDSVITVTKGTDRIAVVTST